MSQHPFHTALSAQTPLPSRLTPSQMVSFQIGQLLVLQVPGFTETFLLVKHPRDLNS